MRAVGASEAKRPHTGNMIEMGGQPLTHHGRRNLKSGAIYGELSARISYPCKVYRFQCEIQMAEYSTTVRYNPTSPQIPTIEMDGEPMNK